MIHYIFNILSSQKLGQIGSVRFNDSYSFAIIDAINAIGTQNDKAGLLT